MTNLKYEKIIEAMATYGGGFVKKFTELWRHADHNNQEKIKSTWANYWSKYQRFVKE